MAARRDQNFLLLSHSLLNHHGVQTKEASSDSEDLLKEEEVAVSGEKEYIQDAADQTGLAEEVAVDDESDRATRFFHKCRKEESLCTSHSKVPPANLGHKALLSEEGE